MTASQTRWVYGFGAGSADGDASMKNLLGGKGANLAEMSSLGLPVPPGFTITTEACVHYYANGQAYPDHLDHQVGDALALVERSTGKTFGDPANPLLVSVRSGARASMPGMMDTVLNLGLNDETVEGLAGLSGDRRFAFDSYRRFIQMYSNVVLGLEHNLFEEILDDHKDRLDVHVDTGLTANDWEAVVTDYKSAVAQELARVGDVLDHLHVEDHVEPFAGRQQGLGGGAAVVDHSPDLGGMRAGRADIALRGVDAGDREAQAAHRLAEQAAAAADIEQGEPLERAAKRAIAAKTMQGLVADEGQSRRVEFMQRRELALRVPPFGGDPREPLDLGRIDARMGVRLRSHAFP